MDDHHKNGKRPPPPPPRKRPPRPARQGDTVSDAERDWILRFLIEVSEEIGEELGVEPYQWDEAGSAASLAACRDVKRFAAMSEAELRGFVRRTILNKGRDAADEAEAQAPGKHAFTEDLERFHRSREKPDRDLEREWVRERITEALGQLSDREQEVFLLIEEHDLSRKEVAEQLGVGQETVKELLARARTKLRESLKDLRGEAFTPDRYDNLSVSKRVNTVNDELEDEVYE